MTISKKMNLHQWAMDLKNQKESGLSVAAWAKVNSIPENTLRYRFKQVELAMEERLNSQNCSTNLVATSTAKIVCSEPEPVFAKINLTAAQNEVSGISIKLSNAEIKISPDTPLDQLRIVMEALSHAK